MSDTYSLQDTKNVKDIISSNEEYYSSTLARDTSNSEQDLPEIAIPGLMSDASLDELDGETDKGYHNPGSSLYEGTVVTERAPDISSNDGGTISSHNVTDQNTVDSNVGIPGHFGIDEGTA